MKRKIITPNDGTKIGHDVKEKKIEDAEEGECCVEVDEKEDLCDLSSKINESSRSQFTFFKIARRKLSLIVLFVFTGGVVFSVISGLKSLSERYILVRSGTKKYYKQHYQPRQI